MIQFCGYHFRFGFLWVQNIGDGINDELRIHSGKTSLIPACPKFGATESTLSKQCTWLQVFKERSDDTILWCSASSIPLPVWIS